MVRTKIALTKYRRYVVLGCAKNYSTITTSFNVHDVLNYELTEITMVKNNIKLSGENFSGDFEYF
jgi:hypothetical protein